jgi:hypothetical protein
MIMFAQQGCKKGTLTHIAAVYTVAGAREVDGTRLVRLHCAWSSPGGVWQGPWAYGAAEWGSCPAAQALATEPQDPAAAWAPFE